jgi:hypothetical protein
MMLREPPRKLHVGDAVAWLVVLSFAGIILALAGCDERRADCEPVYQPMHNGWGC